MNIEESSPFVSRDAATGNAILEVLCAPFSARLLRGQVISASHAERASVLLSQILHENVCVFRPEIQDLFPVQVSRTGNSSHAQINLRNFI